MDIKNIVGWSLSNFENKWISIMIFKIWVSGSESNKPWKEKTASSEDVWKVRKGLSRNFWSKAHLLEGPGASLLTI